MLTIAMATQISKTIDTCDAALQPQATQAGHVHVQDEARGRRDPSGCQEIVGRSEGLNGESE